MPKERDEEYYHNKGQTDASEGRDDPPHQGPVFSKDWWGSDMAGRPVNDKDKRADYDAYEEGHHHTESQKSGGGCFFTTACVEHAGLTDDCHELQVLRGFRDSYVAALPGGDAILEEYYSSAPAILSRIQSSPDRHDVLEALFGTVREAVSLIEAGRLKEAFDAYAIRFATLKSRFGAA